MEYKKADIVKIMSSLPFSESSGAARTKGRAAAFLFLDLTRRNIHVALTTEKRQNPPAKSVEREAEERQNIVICSALAKNTDQVTEQQDLNVGSSSGNFDEECSTT